MISLFGIRSAWALGGLVAVLCHCDSASPSASPRDADEPAADVVSDGPHESDVGEGVDGDFGLSSGDTEVASSDKRWNEPFTWPIDDLTPSRCAAPSAFDPWISAIQAAGLSAEPAIPKAIYEMYGGYIAQDPTRLADFHHLQQDPTTIACRAAHWVQRADAAVLGKYPLTSLLADGLGKLSYAPTVGGEFLGSNSLEATLLELGADASGDWRSKLQTVPNEVQALAAYLLAGARQAIVAREEGLAAILGGDVPLWRARILRTRVVDTFVARAISPMGGGALPLDPDDPVERRVLAPDRDAASLFYGAGLRLAQAVDEADWTLGGPAATAEFAIEVFTPHGWVMLKGAANDEWDQLAEDGLDRQMLLSLDTGGNDTYRVPLGATIAYEHGVSLHVDLGGDDTYGYEEVGSSPNGLLPPDSAGRYVGDEFFGPIACSNTPRQGAGIFGFGFLVDLGGGRDSYRSLRSSQGFGALGIGVLWDDGGDDTYESEATSQGVGGAGVGILYDGGGNDRYVAATSSQGSAASASYALLYDRDGNDEYELLRSPLLYRWYPGGPHNISMGQGAATGMRRPSHVANVNLGGGVALLRDKEGDDRYNGAVMTLGNGYWFGFGILADGAGNDTYDAEVYSQGASEHFAIAAFLEGGGNDRYNVALPNVPPHRNLTGMAHDFSVTVFVDADGDDHYAGRATSLGAAKCHALGIFVDAAGDDTYEGLELRSLGWASNYDGSPGDCGSFPGQPTWGFFIDASGNDSYSKDGQIAPTNNSVWLNDDPATPGGLEYGVGVDAESRTVFQSFMLETTSPE